MSTIQSFQDLASLATEPKPNERASDAYVLNQYMRHTNPVTKSVEFDILVRRLGTCPRLEEPQ